MHWYESAKYYYRQIVHNQTTGQEALPAQPSGKIVLCGPVWAVLYAKFGKEAQLRNEPDHLLIAFAAPHLIVRH